MKGVLKLEIEKHQVDHADMESISESGSVANDSVDPGDCVAGPYGKLPGNGFGGSRGGCSKLSSFEAKEVSGNGSNFNQNKDLSADDVSVTFYLFIASFYSFKKCLQSAVQKID